MISDRDIREQLFQECGLRRPMFYKGRLSVRVMHQPTRCVPSWPLPENL